MPNIPDDVFTEPDFSPDTLANLGPLRRLAGVWQSDEGVDVSPKAEGPERRVFREHIRMEPIDPQPNGPQLLYGLRYHIHINTAEEAITFHDQVGYWLWEPATGLIMPDFKKYLNNLFSNVTFATTLFGSPFAGTLSLPVWDMTASN